MISRRTALAAGLAAMGHAGPSSAQAPGRKRLALLLVSGGAGRPNPWPDGIREPLARLGWVEGRNLEIVIRAAENRLERLPQLARELVASAPDAILTHAQGVSAAAAATATIPIVAGAAGEASLLALAGSLARPAGNVTGLIVSSRDQHEKSVELLKEAVPYLTRLGVLCNPANPQYRDWPAVLAPELGLLSVEATRFEAASAAEFRPAFQAMARAGMNGALLTADPLFNGAGFSEALAAAALEARLPLAAILDEPARAGGLLALSVEYSTLVRRSATFVDHILRGARPGELPVELPTRYQLMLNLTTARALGLTISPLLLARADEVIE